VGITNHNAATADGDTTAGNLYQHERSVHPTLVAESPGLGLWLEYGLRDLRSPEIEGAVFGSRRLRRRLCL